MSHKITLLVIWLVFLTCFNEIKTQVIDDDDDFGFDFDDDFVEGSLEFDWIILYLKKHV